MKRIASWMTAGLLVWPAIGCKGGSSSAGSSYAPKKAPALASAMVAPGQEAQYLPIAVGNQWTYESQTQLMANGRQTSQKHEVTYRITKVGRGPTGGVQFSYDIFSEGKLTDRETWRMEKSGIYQVASGPNLVPFSSPLPMFPFPVKKGTTVKWNGSLRNGKSEASGPITVTINGEEPVDSEAGSFNAVAVESHGTLSTPKGKSQLSQMMWFVPGMGLCRIRAELVGEMTTTDPKTGPRKVQVGRISLMKLKNFSPKR